MKEKEKIGSSERNGTPGGRIHLGKEGISPTSERRNEDKMEEEMKRGGWRDTAMDRTEGESSHWLRVEGKCGTGDFHRMEKILNNHGEKME